MDAMPKSDPSPAFHLWFPNIFEFKGGIQVFSAVFLETLQSLYPQSRYDVFLKQDRPASIDWQSAAPTRFHCAGNVPARLRTPAFAAQLLSQGVQQRPNLVISTHLNYTPVAALLKRLTHVPFWAIAHGIEAWDIQKPSLRKALHHADLILAVSSYTRDRLLKEQNLRPDQVVVLPNTVDGDRFQVAPKPAYLLERYNLQPNQPIILTVNRLVANEPYRGYDKVLEALPQIRQVLPDVHYIIAGKGDDRPRLEQFIAQHNLQDCVTLAGFVPDEELCNYYNLCDVFAMPSKLEGFGIVYLEALACGKPALGGNQDGAIDALCQGKFGALIDPDSVDEIAQALIGILQKTYSNPLLYQPQQLRASVIETYGRESFRKNLAGFLQPQSR